MRGYVEPDATKQKFLKTVRMHVGVCFVQPLFVCQLGAQCLDVTAKIGPLLKIVRPSRVDGTRQTG